MEFSRQKYWSGLPLPFPGDLPNPGIKPRSLAVQADALPSKPSGKSSEKSSCVETSLVLLKGFLWEEPSKHCCCCCITSVVSDSVRPHRQQATRLPRPWDSPGKNTGVGCHFLLQCMKVKSLSHVRLLVTPWTAAYQDPPSMGFSRQEYWSGLPLPSLKNQVGLC